MVVCPYDRQDSVTERMMIPPDMGMTPQIIGPCRGSQALPPAPQRARPLGPRCVLLIDADQTMGQTALQQVPDSAVEAGRRGGSGE